MRVICSGDFHLSLKENYGRTEPDGLNSRVHDKLKAIGTSINYAIENKADLYVSVGDEFDTLNPTELLRYKFIEAVAPLFESNIPYIIIMGNHIYNSIYYNLQSEEKLLKLLKSSKMEIISELKIREIDGIPFSFVPWSYIKEAKSFLKNNQERIVFHHMPISGALLNDYEIKSKEGFNKEDLESQIVFIGGHYHKYQLVDNWCYVGSIVKQDFGERGQKKGFCDIKIENEIDINFIEIPDREFLQLEFSEPVDPIQYVEALGDLNGAVVKSVFSGDKEWLYSINKNQFIKILEDRNAIRVLQPELRTKDDYIKKNTATSSKTPFETSIKEYCKLKNKTEYELIMQEILQEVVNSERII